ncbi:MAG: DUF4124 domain-containing protein [Xanthomonadaceae bacterium]|nr:DUF4124 domain-containing protein [Xanthomonadaceae bacterium]MDP2185842.1 DUF4124 domain-containing protein [Xanthomonadales bacterium]MDZ4115135.1 DUF4124 domain-containing protein [Xanthomonadaceae bacterium]MDZ4379623.1 DUF4124 domain-containing protein [Xanthomonadaceae bacterium]
MRNLFVTRFTTTLALLSLFMGAHAQDQVYHWVDAKGVSHYADSPPPGDDAGVREVVVNRSPPAATATADSTTVASASPAAPSNQSIAAVRMQQCERARQNLATLQSNQDVVQDTDGDGVNELLDAGQRQAELKRAQGAITAFCD